MKKIQIIIDKLLVFTFQIDNKKDKICNIGKHVGQRALHEVFWKVYSDVV